MLILFRSLLPRLGAGLWLVMAATGSHASLVASSAISVTNLQIQAANGTVSYGGPFDSFAFSNAYNSLGESDSNGNGGTGMDVTASSAVTGANGSASALASTGSVSASSLVALGGGVDQAAVSSPGSLASLFGTFGFTGVTGMVDVSISMDVTGLLHAFADALSTVSTDADVSLEINGTAVLFDFFQLGGGPGFADTSQAISETLSFTGSFDSSQVYVFSLNVHVDGDGDKTLPEPATLALSALGLALLGGNRAGSRRPQNPMRPR